MAETPEPTRHDDDDGTAAHRRGMEWMERVYAGEVFVAPHSMLPFTDVMVPQLFGGVWSREALPIRERRLLTMGVIAAVGDVETFMIQVRAALKLGELTPEQIREILIHLAPYAGYPRVAPLVVAVEEFLGQRDTGNGTPDTPRRVGHPTEVVEK